MSRQAVIILAVLFLCAANLFSFGLMAYDKHCARHQKWRVPERRLFLAAACFGGLGGVLAMKLLHHKTKHWNFKTFFPLFLMIQLIVLVFVAYKLLF